MLYKNYRKISTFKNLEGDWYNDLNYIVIDKSIDGKISIKRVIT